MWANLGSQLNFYLMFAKLCYICCVDGASTEENAAKLLKIACITFPPGIVTTIAASVFVFWWQGLIYSNPHAQAILINGKML
jgi:oligosaccharide translocation protein RFT1